MGETPFSGSVSLLVSHSLWLALTSGSFQGLELQVAFLALYDLGLLLVTLSLFLTFCQKGSKAGSVIYKLQDKGMF